MLNEPYSIAKVQIRDALRNQFVESFINPPLSSDPITNQFREIKKDGFKTAVMSIASMIYEDDRLKDAFYDFVCGD